MQPGDQVGELAARAASGEEDRARRPRPHQLAQLGGAVGDLERVVLGEQGPGEELGGQAIGGEDGDLHG